MNSDQLLALFLEKVSSEYPKHMFCYFAALAARGELLPFTQALLRAVGEIEATIPGYAVDTFTRIGAVSGKGEAQYESLLQILSEIYVAQGFIARADQETGVQLASSEPGIKGQKNPELEVRIQRQWFAVEVKAPSLIAHGRERGTEPFQIHARGSQEQRLDLDATLPRDNPVKDFLISADRKFAAYERHRPGAYRLLFIVWDDFCNEPIAALLSRTSGLLTPNTFHRTAKDVPVTYPNIDGVVIVRHLHQLQRATRCEPLVDGVTDPLQFRHEGFPPKAFIQVPSGRIVPEEILSALNITPLIGCIGAEYMAGELTMWIGGDAP